MRKSLMMMRKKHPEIVKNGKKLENGGDDVSPMGDSANVNPALTEVTWTAEEKKANGTGNGTAVSGTGNGTAPAPAESTETEATEAKKVEESEPLKEKEEE